MSLQLLAGLELHVVQHGEELGLLRLGDVFELGDGAVHGDAGAGIGAVGDAGRDVLGPVGHFLVEHGALVRVELLPLLDGLVPFGTLGGVFTTLEIGERRLVGGDDAGARTHLDGQVGQRQTTLHRHGADGAAGIFHSITRGAGGRHPGHDVEGHVLGGGAFGQLALDVDAHRLGLLLQDALRSQHLSHLAGADTHGDGAHGTVRRGVRVAAHDGHAGQREGLLGTHHVDDAVVAGAHGEVADAELLTVLPERLHLLAAYGVVDALLLVAGGVVVGHGHDALGAEGLDTLVAQGVEGLRRGHLVSVEAVDVELSGAVLHVLHDVGVPDFIEKCLHFLNLLIQSI